MEIWEDIKNYEGYYQISNRGNVRGLDRYIEDVNKVQFIKGRQIKPNNSGKGYLKANLCKEGKRYSKFIHRLVAEHFLDNYKDELVVNHKDFNRGNNDISNLELLTQKENIHYSKKSNRYNKIFDREDKDTIIKIIKILNSNGMTKADICRKFKVEYTTLNKYIPNLIKYGTKNMKLNGRKVKCIDTGEIFDYIIDAKQKYNITTIGDCCSGRQKTSAGMRWEYVK